MYLSRVSDYGHAMAIFDQRVDEAVAAIARIKVTPVMKALRGISQRLGGLGLSRMVGVKSERGCLEARANTRHRATIWTDIRLGHGLLAALSGW